MKTIKDNLGVRIVTWEVVNFLCEIQWAQDEMIAILDDALRTDSRELGDLPDGGKGLSKALKVTNWAFEKVIKQVCASEPCLNELYCDDSDEETEAAIGKLREEVEVKLEQIIHPKETSWPERAAAEEAAGGVA